MIFYLKIEIAEYFHTDTLKNIHHYTHTHTPIHTHTHAHIRTYIYIYIYIYSIYSIYTM